jgi:hypothetical protein
MATIRFLCATNGTQKKLQDKVCSQVKEFLKMVARTIPSLEHMLVFHLARGVGANLSLVMLILSPMESNHKCVPHETQKLEEFSFLKISRSRSVYLNKQLPITTMKIAELVTHRY